ncbi:MAG TPA: ATP-binding domain-containing protein, partial [Gemmatimonadaceae bacterium]|nr:ATP-binding domain-containing protein [Gemmatimonadaceae bacterium]
ARLMLVGDHHQLSSVEAGDVLGVLCRAADAGEAGSALHAAVTRLTHSHRFASQPKIGALAAAILARDEDAALQACGTSRDAEVRLQPPVTGPALLDPVSAHLERCLAASSPVELLDALDAFRLLAPEREGRTGVSGLNAAVERWLVRHGRPVGDPWYHGRPVLVTANDYATRVFNGDVGVVWKADGRTTVHFRSVDASVRAIAAGRLPSVETAWAMTVHKSQGSEFDDVVVVLPADESRVMSRELLYTAVTRARRSVTIVAHEPAVRAAIGQGTTRTSGLERLLRS